MSTVTPNLQSLLATQFSALSGASTATQGVSSGLGSSQLFANLIASLQGQGPSVLSTGAANGTASSPSAAAAGANNAQISQDLDAFLQSLRQALTLAEGGKTGDTASHIGSAGTVATLHHGHHAHGHGSTNATLSELMNDLSGDSSSAVAAANGSSSASNTAGNPLANLNSTFTRLLNDLRAVNPTGKAVNSTA